MLVVLGIRNKSIIYFIVDRGILYLIIYGYERLIIKWEIGIILELRVY